MKNKVFTGIVLLFALAACNQNQTKEAPAEYPVNDPQLGNVMTDTSRLSLSDETQCYTAFVKTDSAFLSIQETNGEVTGKLWYKFAEKDNSKGNVKGTLDNDTLKLTYTFDAEGKTSKMPIKLSHKDGNLYENYDGGESGGFVFVKSKCRDY